MAPVSVLFPAPPQLAGCFLAGVYRDTRGAALSAPDRMNHFPASPMVAVTLVRHGALHLLTTGGHWSEVDGSRLLPRISVMAPQELPTTSWAKSEVEALTLAIFPDAWGFLGGDPSFEVIPASLQGALDAFSTAQTPQAGWDALCGSLGAHWAETRSEAWHSSDRMTDWVKGLITRAALSGSGRSLRSLERRIKRLTGHSRRTLEFFSMMEGLQTVLQEHGDAPLADIAHLAGYSDQSHMGRAVLRVTGFSPARLNQAIATEEAFWCYRLLGERF